MCGMAGGSAGQFLVGPLIKGGVGWAQFWIYAGLGGLALGTCLRFLLPTDAQKSPKRSVADVFRGFKTVFLNPQSILCGLISGLLFIPTTIFGMTWGVRFLQEARGREYETAVALASTLPVGWMIGCPLLGYVSDKLGRRKPVILGGILAMLVVMAWILFGDPAILRGHLVGLMLGIASGVAMLPYSVIKEANSPELSGSAAGIINFINFTLSALLGPVFGARLAHSPGEDETLALAHYQAGFTPLLYGIAIAFILTNLLKETGPAVSKPPLEMR
jgi:predicted MFS family arabinose efflux permease